MSYCEFLTSLFAEGRVSVGLFEEILPEEIAAAEKPLGQYEQSVRLDGPAGLPPFAPHAASWAAVRCYRACQFAVYRDLPAVAIQEQLGEPFGGPVTAAEHYSIDLTFRFLPDLLRFASSASENDPLVGQLMQWAVQWPLSSVGIPRVEGIAIDGIAENPALMQMYVDRVIALGDAARLSDSRVANGVRVAIGRFPALGGKLNRTLEELHDQEQTK